LNIRPEDWRSVDSLIDWIIDKNKAGYQMVNSVQRLQEMKAFVRMSDLKQYGWYGDGTSANGNIAAMLVTHQASPRTRAASCISPTGTAVPARTT